MYIWWLLEFVWRIFIQGPLLIIDFISKNISNFIFIKVDFVSENNLKLFNYAVVAGVAFALMAIVLVVQFLYIFSINEGSVKERMQKSFANLGKSLLILLFLPVILFVCLILFNVIVEFIEEILNISKTSTLADGLYKLIVGTNAVAGNSFLPPVNEKLEKLNFVFAIFLVWSVLIVIFWIAFSFIQKIIEAFILYITFPFAAIASVNSNTLKRSIWLKELFRKFVFLIALMFIFEFYITILTAIVTKNQTGNKEIVVLVISFALMFAIFSLVKFTSYLLKQHSGIISTFKSSKQTMNFMTNVKNENYENLNGSHYETREINNNIETIRAEIRSSNKNQKNYSGLKNAKVIEVKKWS